MNSPKGTDSGTDRAEDSETPQSRPEDTASTQPDAAPAPAVERGGPKGLEPTRYGDWERKGRCIDF